MKRSGKMPALICCAAMLSIATILTTLPTFAYQAANRASEAIPIVKDECVFLDGSTISFGQKASGARQSGDDVWRVGSYAATAFRVSERMLIPPLDKPINIPPGMYTLFVDPSKGEPWILIVSKKTGLPGMPYPGAQYDLGRTQMGFDDSFRQPIPKFVIGCTQRKDGPIFISMASDVHVAYAKIMAVGTRNGKTQWLVH